MAKSAAPRCRLDADVIKRLRDVQKHITEEPRRLKMSSFITYGSGADAVTDCSSPKREPHKFPACGTAACIAGWAVLLSGEKPGLIRTQAKKLIGFPEWENEDDDGLGDFTPEDILFEVSDWPPKFRGAYRRAKNPATLARITCARIEHFIATKGAE